MFSHHWKAVLLGQLVCEEREEWSVQTAKTLCQRLQQDTHTALDKVCVCARAHTPPSIKLFPLTHHMKLIFFVFNVLCVCLDRPPPPAVWPVSLGAARRGEVTASGGEVHPGKLPRGTGRHTEMTRRTVVMHTRCRHREPTWLVLWPGSRYRKLWYIWSWTVEAGHMFLFCFFAQCGWQEQQDCLTSCNLRVTGLFPGVLKEVWPQARHWGCSHHHQK